MLNRRAFVAAASTFAVLGGGAWALSATNTVDDVARALHIQPRQQPDPEDVALARRVAKNEATLQADIAATHRSRPNHEPLERCVRIATEHLRALEAATPTTGRSLTHDELLHRLASAEHARHADAVLARSGQLAMLLGVIGAAHAQQQRDIAKEPWQ